MQCVPNWFPISELFEKSKFKFFRFYSKTCVKQPLKITKTKILMTNDNLMKIESIAECFRSILQYFWPAFSYNWSWKPIFGLFESGRLRQVLLYCIKCIMRIKFSRVCTLFRKQWGSQLIRISTVFHPYDEFMLSDNEITIDACALTQSIRPQDKNL